VFSASLLSLLAAHGVIVGVFELLFLVVVEIVVAQTEYAHHEAEHIVIAGQVVGGR
jgi:hypothetical protein